MHQSVIQGLRYGVPRPLLGLHAGFTHKELVDKPSIGLRIDHALVIVDLEPQEPNVVVPCLQILMGVLGRHLEACPSHVAI